MKIAPHSLMFRPQAYTKCSFHKCVVNDGLMLMGHRPQYVYHFPSGKKQILVFRNYALRRLGDKCMPFFFCFKFVVLIYCKICVSLIHAGFPMPRAFSSRGYNLYATCVQMHSESMLHGHNLVSRRHDFVLLDSSLVEPEQIYRYIDTFL